MVDFMEIDEQKLSFEFENFLEGPLTSNIHDSGKSNNNDDSGEICKFFLKGTCTKGNSCPFKHSKADRAVVCKHWLRGLCKKGDNCEFLHEYDLSKMPECHFFSKFGECSNADCMYLHINPEDKVKECPWFARGFCKHGSSCRHKHIKKIACANYLLGFCPEGPNCVYGHPKYELPKDDESNPNRKVRTPMICHKCGVIGHKASACPSAKDTGRDSRGAQRSLDAVTCFKCGQTGHYANHCPNVAGGAPNAGNNGGYHNNPSGGNRDGYSRDNYDNRSRDNYGRDRDRGAPRQQNDRYR